LIAFLLDTPYFGSVRTPNYAVSVGESKPAIVVEVGISQHFESLEERARMWLVGKLIHLVILVDIQVCKTNTPRKAYKISNEEESPQTTLPYGLTMDDLYNNNFQAIGSKILGWHKTQKQTLVQILLGTIYLYRHVLGDRSSIC
jgi:hypothetical protein